jgi:hypothetical protein
MSLMLYLASNSPLDTVANPHRRRLSVNEALDMGITNIPDHMFTPDFDKDMPDVILWSDINIIIDTENGTFDDGGFDDDFEIYNMDEYYGPTDSEKDFKVVIECDLTLGRAENILDYIRQQLEYTDEIELWSIWLGDYDQKISWYEAKIQEFTAADLLEIAELPVKQQPLKHHCVRIRK